jgi:transposase
MIKVQLNQKAILFGILDISSTGPALLVSLPLDLQLLVADLRYVVTRIACWFRFWCLDLGDVVLRFVVGSCLRSPLLVGTDTMRYLFIDELWVVMGPRIAAAKTVDRVWAIDVVMGDTGFDGEPQRQACRDHDVVPVIPAKSNRVNPEPMDQPAYRKRNRIERLFAKAKEFHRVVTGYQKRMRMFLGRVQLVFGFIRLRAKNNVNRPWPKRIADGTATFVHSRQNLG